jgi:hypothetical protein
MPETPQSAPAPKLDPAYDYASLPDGSYAQFKKGTPPEAMRAQLIAKGLLKQSAAKPAAKQSQPGFGKRYAQTMQIPTSKEELGSAMRSTSGVGFAYQTGKGIYEGAKASYEDAKAGHLLKSAADFVSGLAPFPAMLGTNIGEDIKGKNIKGLAGTAAGLGTQALLMHEGTLSPEAHRTLAKNLDTAVLKTADPTIKDYNRAVGLEVAQKRVMGTLKSLPDKIEQPRMAQDAKVQALTKYHDAQGHLVNGTPEIRPLVDNVRARLNVQGLLTDRVRNAFRDLVDQITTEHDPRTGQRIPIDLSKLTVAKAIELTKGLGKMANWDADVKVAVEPFIKQIRQGINNALDKVDPEITKARESESKLIEAREAARKNYADALNDKKTLGFRMVYGSGASIATYLGLKMLGVIPTAAIGSIILTKSLWQSTLSRTTRAALHAYAADILESAIGGQQGPQGAASGPNPPTGGGTALPSGTPRSGPVSPAGAPLTSPRGLGAAPAAPRAPAGGSVTPSGRPVTAAEHAVQATSGTRGIAADITKWQPPPELGVSHSPDYGKNIRSEVKGRQGVAKSTTTSAEPATQSKAMLDRLDVLLERQPRSGAENNAIKREIREIKRVLSGEAQGNKHAGDLKRIADRERLAAKRTEAKTTQTGSVSTSGEAVAQGSSPETRAIALDAGYKALAHYEGGDMMVKALKSTAKAMQKVDPSYDEVEKLTEALNVLKSLPKEEQ